ncbi:MAG: Ig-like domain-containing protein [Chloroflexota bacterium]
MTERTDDEDKRHAGGTTIGSQKKAALIVIGACLLVVAAILALRQDELSVRSDVQTAPEHELGEEVLESTPNSPPEVISLAPATDRITPFDLCDIVCEAVDPDGDELTYTWSASQGDIYGEGATVEWGSPVNEGLYQLTVTVDDGQGGSAELSTSLRVKSNSKPVIVEMTSDRNWVVPGDSAYLSSTAQDADGDELEYQWEATGGELHGSGTSAVWVAPETEGAYWITIRARDAYNGEAVRAIPVSVTRGEPPLLGDFIVQGVKTNMVSPTGDAWKIFRGRTLSVECVVEDGEAPFTYEWSVDRGTLIPDGKTATWEAPDTRVSATIVVDVTDANGNTASGSLLVYVETCTCSFG